MQTERWQHTWARPLPTGEATAFKPEHSHSRQSFVLRLCSQATPAKDQANLAFGTYVVAIGASPIGTLACVDACIEDFRKDSPGNDVPTIIIHGDDDRMLPANENPGGRRRGSKTANVSRSKGGSRGITWTRAEEIKAEVVKFLA